MYRRLCDASEMAAKIINAEIIPVGNVIQSLRENVKEFDYKNGGISLCRDGFHLSLDYGRFVAAAVWYTVITGRKVNAENFIKQNDVILNPTCHFKAANLIELAEQFLNSQFEDAKLFYIWGHSYELVTEKDWVQFEDFCKLISGRSDIWYCTNIEAIYGIKKL